MGSLPLPFTETGDLAVATTSSTLRPSRAARVLRYRQTGTASAILSHAPPGGLRVPVLLPIHGTRIGAKTTRSPMPTSESPGKLGPRREERQSVAE